MKYRLWFLVFAFCGFHLLGGCASSKTSEAKPAVLIVVRVAGGGPPTPQQAEAVQRAITPAVLPAGLQFASTQLG